ATGAPSMIESRVMVGAHGRFDVAVLRGTTLEHWTHDNTSTSNPWTRRSTIATGAKFGGSLIHGTIAQATGNPGNFEVVVPVGPAAAPPPNAKVRGTSAGTGTDYDLRRYRAASTSTPTSWTAESGTITFR